MAEGTNLAKAYVQILPSMDGFQSSVERELGDAGTGMGRKAGNSFGAGFASAASSVASAGIAAVTAAAGATAGFTKAAIETGREFDSAMSQVAATLGMTTEDIENNVDNAGETFEALRKTAKEMGAATNFSASEAAEGLNILAMSGFDASQSIEMVDDVLHLAAAGSMDMASAAGYVSGAMKGFNDETKDAQYYADLMAKGATLANTSVSQLGDALSGAAAMGSAYGQSAEDMTVSLLRLAEQGEVGSNAATMLSAAMANIYTPMDQAKKAMDELGVSAYDESGGIREFNDVINDLNEAIERNSGGNEELANQYKDLIFGKQGLAAFNKLVVTGTEKQDEWAEALARASDGAGEAAKQYATMTDNLQGDIDIWNSALDGFKVAISDKIMPTVRDFVQLGSEGLGKITAGFEESGFEGAMEAFGEVLSDLLAKIGEILPDVLTAGSTLILTLAQGIAENMPQVVSAFTDALTIALPQLAEAGSILLGAIVTSIVDNLPELLTAAVDIITTLANDLAEALPELIPQIVDIILTIVEILTDPDVLLPLLNAALAIVLGLTEGLLEALPELIDRLPEIVTAIVDTLVEFAPELFEAALVIIEKLAEGIIKNLPKLLSSALQIILTLLAGITKQTDKIIQKGAEIVDNVKKGFKQKVDDAKTWGRDMIDNFVDGITEKWDDLKSAVTGVADTISDLIGFSEPEYGPLSDFHTYAPDMMDLYSKGITDNAYKVEDSIDTLLGNVRNDFGRPVLSGTQSAPITSSSQGGTITLRLVDNANRLIAEGTAGIIDIINGNTVALSERGLASV